jgi:glycosyltransferase involved in cell wall biosynthesis
VYKKLVIGVAVPAYNEEKLIQKTLATMPKFVDHIVVVNDASKDKTLQKMREAAKQDSRIEVIDNTQNLGVGGSIKKALQRAAELGCDRVAVMAGDAQMDPDLLDDMLDDMQTRKLDFIKANRFMHLDALRSMPAYRRIGNIIVTLLTKIATGYYGIFDSQNGYVIYSKKVIGDMPWRLVGNRYEFENTVLIGLSIIDARVGDFAAPAIYGEEKSTIKLFSTTLRVLRVLIRGYWQRIYYKYVLFNFHPIAVFIFGGMLFGVLGIALAVYLAISRIFLGETPSAGSVMLAVLPIVVGLQLVLTAFILDVLEDKK